MKSYILLLSNYAVIVAGLMLSTQKVHGSQEESLRDLRKKFLLVSFRVRSEEGRKKSAAVAYQLDQLNIANPNPSKDQEKQQINLIQTFFRARVLCDSVQKAQKLLKTDKKKKRLSVMQEGIEESPTLTAEQVIQMKAKIFKSAAARNRHMARRRSTG